LDIGATMKLATYDDWKHCITVECGIPLTPQYVEERIAALKNPKDHHTQKFLREYGQPHLIKVIGWFEKAMSEISASQLTQ